MVRLWLIALVAAVGCGADAAPSVTSDRGGADGPAASFSRVYEASWPATSPGVPTPLCLGTAWCWLVASDSSYQPFLPASGDWHVASPPSTGASVGMPTSFANSNDAVLMGSALGFTLRDYKGGLQRVGNDAHASVAACHSGFCVAMTPRPELTTAGLRLFAFDSSGEPFNEGNAVLPNGGQQQLCAPVADSLAPLTFGNNTVERRVGILYRRFLKNGDTGIALELRLAVVVYAGVRYSGVDTVADILLDRRTNLVDGTTSCSDLYKNTAIQGQSLHTHGAGLAAAWRNDAGSLLSIIGYSDQKIELPAEEPVPYLPGTTFLTLPGVKQLVAVVPQVGNTYARFVAVDSTGYPSHHLDLDPKITGASLAAFGRDQVIVITRPAGQDGKPGATLVGRLLRYTP